MRESTYSSGNNLQPGWGSVLAYLALPLLLFTAAVVVPILNLPAQGLRSPIDPATRRALIAQWNEIYTSQTASQQPLLVFHTSTPVAVFVAGH